MKRKQISKLLAITLTAAMAVTAFTGCSGGSSSEAGKSSQTSEMESSSKAPEESAAQESGTDSDSAGGQTITVAASSNWVKDVDKELASKYEEESGNTIEWQISPDDQYENVLNSKLSVGEGADIFYIRSGVTINKYQPEKYMMDLSDQEWAGRYRDWAKEGTTYDGKIVQFQTWGVDGWGILYNKDIFAEAGVEKVPTDYGSFKDACDKILAAGKTPIYQPGAAQWHWGCWLGEMTSQTEVDSPGFYAGMNDNSQSFVDQEGLKIALDQLVEISEAGYFGDDFMANTWEDMPAKMASGDYAMGLVYTTFPAEVEAINAEMPADSWSMFPIPLNDNKVFGVSAGGLGRCVNKDTKVADAALDYLAFLSRPENLQTYYDARLDLGECSFNDIPGNASASYADVMANASGTAFTAEDGILYWDGTQTGTLVQSLFVGGASAEDVLKGIDDMRQPNFG